MIPPLQTSFTFFALSFVTFSSLLFFAMMRVSTPLRGLNREEFGLLRYKGQGQNRHSSSSTSKEEEEEVEEDCAVCLNRLQDGDEIKELGCDHVFHMSCFDRWASHCRYTTCPVCRRLIESTEIMFKDNSVKVLNFRLWDFGNGGDDQSNWWLR